METEHKITLARIAGSIVLLAVAHFEPGLTETCQIILYAAAYMVIGGDIVWNALRNVVRGEVFDENFLMAVATAGAFATGQYPEAVAVMLFYQIGEMFLGPLEQSKPWDTNGIDGVHKFLRRFWRLFFDRDGQLCVTDEKATEQELRTLHKTIKKVSEDIENFSFNTSVAAFMICLNELGECSKREVLEPLTVLLAPFAPHIAEELWAALGHTESVCTASYPVCDETHLVRNSFEYPVSVNGKLRFRKEYAASMTPAEIQADVVTAPEAQKWLEGKTPKKIIVVPGKIINIVI